MNYKYYLKLSSVIAYAGQFECFNDGWCMNIKKYVLLITNKVLQNEKGSEYVSEIFKFALIMALIISFVALPEPFMKKLNLNSMATSIARAVETTGEINTDIEQMIEDYKAETGLNPTIKWEGDFVNVGSAQRIQIRERFSITLTDKVKIKIAEPSFSGPIEIEIPISKTVRGLSEVYWKPGQI